MGKKFVIHDTADVTITHKKTGKIAYNAEMQLASITGTLSEEDLRGGIGNKKLYKIRTDKDINLAIRSAFSDMEFWAMTQGVEVDPLGSSFVTKSDSCLTATLDGADIVVTISDVDVTEVFVVGKDGEQETIPAVAGKVVLPAGLGIEEGDEVQVYWKKEVIGRKVELLADKYSDAYSVEYRTISYDPDTHEQYSNIYFIFPNCVPGGDFEISLENGTVYTPEVNFSVMGSGCSKNYYGEIIEEVVVETVAPIPPGPTPEP